jgi:pimeloyl-ACP methyl ester carboxylesterase
VGLYILNTLGIHSYDSLNVLFFNLPDEVPLRRYTYRSNLSNAPDDYKEGLRAIDKPLLVIVGSNDEAFIAKEYEPAIKSFSSGKVVIIEGATHNGIRHDKNAMETVEQWIKSLN